MSRKGGNGFRQRLFLPGGHVGRIFRAHALRRFPGRDVRRFFLSPCAVQGQKPGGNFLPPQRAMDRLLLTLTIIFVSLLAGYGIRQWVSSGRAPLSETALLRLRLIIQKAAMFGLIPVSAMLSL